jgi:TRAP-type mannitol/chloroaromatic compound transport system permease small subunit
MENLLVKSNVLINKNLFANRFLGWFLINTLVAFMINNVLYLAFNIPFAVDFIFKNDIYSIIPTLIYLTAFGFSFFIALKNSHKSYIWDSDLLHRFNLYFIRSCFWSVFLIGSIDVIIAFMRVEEISNMIFNDELVRALKKPSFVCTFVHIPLVFISFVIGYFSKTLGFTWLALMIVCAELIIVITRFVFSYEQSFMGDLVRYWYAALFLFASAYTLFEDGHVRVDVFYTNLKVKTKSFVNAIGSIFLGISTCIAILFVGFNGKQSIINSPILNFEITQTGSVGMFVKYQLAAFLGIFAISMLIQFVSYYFSSLAKMNELKES